MIVERQGVDPETHRKLMKMHSMEVVETAAFVTAPVPSSLCGE
jgi:hypothetical protein